MNGIHGILLILTGMIHIVYGLLPHTYLHDWQKFFIAGLWDTVSTNNDKGMAAFWFIIAGLLMLLVGLAIFEIEKLKSVLPLSIGIAFFAITALGCIMAPKSGFTLFLLPQSIFYFYSSLKNRA